MKTIVSTSVVLVLLLSARYGAWAQGTDPLVMNKDVTSGSLPGVTPLPSGTSTILGGSIRDVDPVLDGFTLKVTGEKPMRILFDERTQLFLDGKKIPLRELRAAEHASVQTVLDGTSVFALSIHILSQLQQGDYRGEVVSYSPETGELEVASGKGGQPVIMHVSSSTRFSRTGQQEFTSEPTSAANLQPGALVSIQFEPDGKGHASALGITFLATRGARFVFGGKLVALDTQGGTMVLVDPRDNRTYDITFSQGVPGIQDLRSGDSVRVTAEYDGTRYLARDVTRY